MTSKKCLFFLCTLTFFFGVQDVLQQNKQLNLTWSTACPATGISTSSHNHNKTYESEVVRKELEMAMSDTPRSQPVVDPPPPPSTWTIDAFEVVMSRFSEPNSDIQWALPLAKHLTIYNQNPSLPIKPLEKSNLVNITDQGHDAYSKLTHIIDRYASLSNVTLFVQARISDRADQFIVRSADSFVPGQRPGSVWGDFYSTSPTVLVYHPTRGPPHRLPRPPVHFYDCPLELSDVCTDLFGETYSNQDAWAPGYWIAVGKDRILGRPLQFWIKMRDWLVSTSDDDPNECSHRTRSIYIERLFVKALMN